MKTVVEYQFAQGIFPHPLAGWTGDHILPHEASVGGHVADPGIELGTDSIGSVIVNNGPPPMGIVEQAVKLLTVKVSGAR